MTHQFNGKNILFLQGLSCNCCLSPRTSCDCCLSPRTSCECCQFPWKRLWLVCPPRTSCDFCLSPRTSCCSVTTVTAAITSTASVPHWLNLPRESGAALSVLRTFTTHPPSISEIRPSDLLQPPSISEVRSSDPLLPSSISEIKSSTTSVQH